MKSKSFVNTLKNKAQEQKTFSDDHSENLDDLAYLLARQISKDHPESGIDEQFAENMKIASSVHDIGKLMIPVYILKKPGRFTDEEYHVIKEHPEKGIEILNKEISGYVKTLDDRNLFNMCRDVILYHHERSDGSGYPYSLKGQEIPVSAQIMAIVDSFDAMTTKRVYKNSRTAMDAINELVKDGNKYNQSYVRSFRKVLEENDIMEK